MKYIKKFESVYLNYEIGDFVKLDNSTTNFDNRYNEDEYSYAEIIEINDNKTYPYYVRFLIDDNELVIKSSEIMRKMTDDEILEQERIKTSKKYNL